MDESRNEQQYFFRLKQAGQFLHISPRSLLRAVKNGQLRGRKVKGIWLFTRSSLVAFGLGFGPRLSAVERKEFQELTSGN